MQRNCKIEIRRVVLPLTVPVLLFIHVVVVVVRTYCGIRSAIFSVTDSRAVPVLLLYSQLLATNSSSSSSSASPLGGGALHLKLEPKHRVSPKIACSPSRTFGASTSRPLSHSTIHAIQFSSTPGDHPLDSFERMLGCQSRTELS